MAEIITAIKELFVAAGSDGTTQIALLTAMGYLIYKIVKTQDVISVTQRETITLLSSHHQNALDMHATCREHGDQLTKLTETVAEHTTAIEVLQATIKK